MPTTKLSKKLVSVLVALVAVAAGSVAYAAVPAADGVIHGCYDKASGALRVTDADTGKPKACTSREASLDWNQQGAPGKPGISLYANVARDGSLVSGTAVSVQKDGQGEYRVYFARDVAQCAPVAETGAFDGASANWTATFTTSVSSGLPTGEVIVFGHTSDGNSADGSFHLIVAC